MIRATAPALEAQNPTLPQRRSAIDLTLLSAVLALLTIGTVSIYSSSAVYAERGFGSSEYFLVRQVVYLALGLVAMWWGARTDYSWMQRRTYLLLGSAMALLILVVLFGAKINGASRWFRVGPLSVQPVEFAKLALVAYLAHSLSRKREKVRAFTVGFMPHLTVCGLMVGLLLLQPDLGSGIILGSTTLILLFVAGTKISYLLLALLAALPVGYYAVVGTPWRMNRLMAYLDPWQFREGVGYQITESLISIGSGGLLGQGLGDGKQKLFYMPEAHSDFIMASLGEELGFAGFALVLVLFAVVVWRGVRAAASARDLFGTYLAFGLVSILALQALVNTSVVLGIIPAKGLTLPFMSYGGTSLITCMFFTGVLLNVGRRSPRPAARTQRIRNVLPPNRRRHRPIRVAVVTRESDLPA